jgi:putative transposase
MRRHPSQSRKLRLGRYSEPNRIYFVTSCCEARARIFERHDYARLVLAQGQIEQAVGDCASLAMVVMPDHIHWLLGLKNGRSLQRIIGSLKGRSALQINRLRRARGRIWQAGFHDHAIRKEESLENIAAYLLNNPVRAGLVSKFDEYPFWTSVWHERDNRG